MGRTRDAWAVGLAGIFVLAACVHWAAPMAGEAQLSANHHFGEVLIHGIADRNFNSSMPLAGVVGSLLQNHLPRGAVQVVLLSIMGLTALLVFGLGRALHSNLCGLIALAAALLFGYVERLPRTEYMLYHLSFLLAANLLLHWNERRDPGRTVLLGLGIGLSLLTRSPLFLFPAVLAVYAFFTGPRKGRRARALAIWPVFAVPALLLGPWVFMNARVTGKFVPFEGEARAERNIMAGALGLTAAFEGGDFPGYAGLAENEVSVGRWAAGEMASHPVRTAAAFFRRGLYAASLHPVLVLFAVFSAWFFRRSERHRLLALLAGYFVAAHCVMAVEHKLFFPLWLLLAPMAAAPFADRIAGRAERTPGSALLALAAAVLIPLSAAGAWSLVLAAAYPFRSAGPPDLDGAIARHPKDPWLRSQRGRERLARGEYDAAVSDFSAAARAVPSVYDYALDEAWARLLAGQDIGALLRALNGGRGSWINFEPERIAVIEGLHHLSGGRDAGARTAFERAAERWRSKCWSRKADTERERKIESEVCGGTRGFGWVVIEAVRPWGPERALGALKQVAALGAADAAIFGEIAALAAETGDDDALVACAEGLLAKSPGMEELERTAVLLIERGAFEKAVAVVAALEKLDAPAPLAKAVALYEKASDGPGIERARNRLAALSPGREVASLAGRGGDYHAGLARALARQGMQDAAVAALRREAALRDDPSRVRTLVEALVEIGRARDAFELSGRALARLGDAPELLMARAAAAAADRRKDEARAALARAAALEAGTRGLLAAAALHEALGDGTEAAAILDRLAGREPRNPAVLIPAIRVLAATGKRKRAAALLAALPDPEAHAESLGGALDLFEINGNHAAAIGVIAKLLRKKQSDTRLRLAHARHLFLAGRKSEAEVELGRIAGIPDDAGDIRGLCRLRDELGDAAGAEACFDALAARFPKEAPAIFRVADLALARGDKAKAAAAVEKALASRPGRNAEVLAADLLGRAGRPERAAAVLDALIRAEPGDPSHRIALAGHLGGIGRRDEARAALSRAESLDPSPEQRLRIALAYQTLGDYDKAVSVFTGLTGPGPLAAAALKGRGLAKFLTSRPEEAAADLEKAIALEPGLLSAHLSLGSIRAAQGRTAAARDALERGLAAAPSPGEESLRSAIEEQLRDLRAR